MSSLRVRHLGGFVFEAESASTPTPHTVDLTARAGHGVCTCPFHAMVAIRNLERRKEQIKRDCLIAGEKVTDRELATEAHIPYAEGRKGVTECKHVAAARQWLWAHRIRPLLAACEQGTPQELSGVLSALLRP